MVDVVGNFGMSGAVPNGQYLRSNGSKMVASPILAADLPSAGTARTSQLSVANTTTETDVITKTLTSGVLLAGTTFRISISGTIQCQATSGTLAFSPYLGPNIAQQTFGLSSGSALGPGGFDLTVLITVRSAGASGAYVAHGHGLWSQGSWFALTSSATGTSVVDTTASTPVIKLTAQWQTASATNILKVETAVIEQVA